MEDLVGLQDLVAGRKLLAGPVRGLLVPRRRVVIPLDEIRAVPLRPIPVIVAVPPVISAVCAVALIVAPLVLLVLVIRRLLGL